MARSSSRRIDTQAVARCAHALSDRTRLAILERLRAGEQCVCNLTGVLAAGQSRLSFHLKTLKDAGLVRDRRDGRWIHYSLSAEGQSVIEALLSALDQRRSA